MKLMISMKIKSNWKCALWFMVILLLCISRASEIEQHSSYPCGYYKILVDTVSKEGPALNSKKIQSIYRENQIRIVEVLTLDNNSRVRGKTADGAWITLKNLISGQILARPVQVSGTQKEELITKYFQNPTLIQENIESMTNKQLKIACEEFGLNHVGNKKKLQNRLLGLMKQDNDPKINILVECSWSCIWFIILHYVGIQDIINHLLVTNQTIYQNIMKFKFDDSKQSMIKLLDLYPKIESYVMWISSHKPYALELFLNLQEYYTDISFLSALQKLFVNIYSIPPIDHFMHIEDIDVGYEFYVGIQTQDVILYDNDEKAIHSIVPTPVNFTLFFLFIFHDVQILYALSEIEYISVHRDEINYAIFFTKEIETIENISIGLEKSYLLRGHEIPCVVVYDCPESWDPAPNIQDMDDYPCYDDIEIITDGYLLTRIYIPKNLSLS